MSNSKISERNFWLKIASVMLVLFLLHAAMIPFVDGNFSLGLYKVSGPQQHNLIIGTSRIAQALKPSALKEELGADFLNFAIDASSTSYSEMYNNAIRKKIDPNTKDGVFILSLDPWTLSRIHDPKTKEIVYTENESALGKLWTFNQPLNIEYLYRDCNTGWGSILMTHLRNNSTVNGHKDGWVEVTRPTDKAFIQARKESKLKARRAELEDVSFSIDRVKALESLIEFLAPKGEIYLIRLPVDPDFVELENELMPNFNVVVDSITNKYDLSFYDMQFLNSEVIFNDGHHINKEYSSFISKKVADWIKLQRAEKKN
jgi:hypothetical protein